MGIELRQDSDGNEFQVWAQEQMMSCSVASIWMARSLVRQMTFEETEWELAWRTYHSAVQGFSYANGTPPSAPAMSFDPSVHPNDDSEMGGTFGRAGALSTHVADMLRSEDFTVIHSTAGNSAQRIQTNRIGGAKAGIALVGWYQRNGGRVQRTGGHYIVAARQNSSNQIVYLDPAGGVLTEFNNNARYRSNGLIEEVIYIS